MAQPVWLSSSAGGPLKSVFVYWGSVSSLFMNVGGSSSGGIRVVVCQREGCWFDPRAPPPPS